MTTKVFISWSGDLSNKLAEAVRDWLPGVLQYVQPYFTPTDIEKGTKWGIGIPSELEESSIGIICLTPDNLTAPWILFEAGALSKNVSKSNVCTVLFRVKSSDLTGPLIGFQDTKFNKRDFKNLIETINNQGGDTALKSRVLDDVFEKWWPDLEGKINKILNSHDQNKHDDQPERPIRELLEEILTLSRVNSRKAAIRNVHIHPGAFKDLYNAVINVKEISNTLENSRLEESLIDFINPMLHLVRGNDEFTLMILDLERDLNKQIRHHESGDDFVNALGGKPLMER